MIADVVEFVGGIMLGWSAAALLVWAGWHLARRAGWGGPR